MSASTIAALASGPPPCAIAVVRVSGRQARDALVALAGRLPAPRRATRATLRAADGSPLDDALILWMPGPGSATGEDVAELHLHGSRAVVAAVLEALLAVPDVRLAEAGEFTRRAFEQGRIDLAQAEGLAQLLAAETETARRAALRLSEGALGRQVAAWDRNLTAYAAQIEARLDHGDEDDVPDALDRAPLTAIRAALADALAQPPAERLHDGIRVVLTGAPNAGKSSLVNALTGRDAAIVTAQAGTTRDAIEVPVTIDGAPLIFVDTAGLRDAPGDAVEAIGIARARAALAQADIILALDGAARSDPRAIALVPRCDVVADGDGLRVSAVTGEGLATLRAAIVARARTLLPAADTIALNIRQRGHVADAAAALDEADHSDELIAGEAVRRARAALARITGRDGVESLLDAIFGQFCIGK